MHTQLQQKLDEYRSQRNFNGKEWIQEKCGQFNQYMSDCGLKACVISVSGGIDSAVTAALCKRAMGVEGSPIKKVIGINQPIHSSDWALARSREACKALDIPLVVIDQSEIHDSLRSVVEGAVGISGKAFATGQLRSYQRTPVGYYVAQLLSQEGTPAIVMGTGNMDEDGYLLYYCKAGDGVVDVQLIADLHKSEVFKVGAELGVVKSILEAPPSADLWDGQTDEEELGFTYDFIELYTGGYLSLNEEDRKKFVNSLTDAEALDQFNEWAKAAENIHRRNKHKLNSPKNINILKIVCAS